MGNKKRAGAALAARLPTYYQIVKNMWIMIKVEGNRICFHSGDEPHDKAL
jgi:hypothetical protein